jgi:hypothetical protein
MSFRDSSGERYHKNNIDANIRIAKQMFGLDNEDKKYCWACGRGDRHISCSHIISVNNCQNDGMVEYAWDKANLQYECVEKCHLETEIRNMNHHKNADYKWDYIRKYNRHKIKLGKI